MFCSVIVGWLLWLCFVLRVLKVVSALYLDGFGSGVGVLWVCCLICWPLDLIDLWFVSLWELWF